MNNNPLIPQGSLLEQKPKGKPNLPVIVFVLVAIHVVIFGGMLMSGCKRDDTATQKTADAKPTIAPMGDQSITQTTASAVQSPVTAPAGPGSPVPDATATAAMTTTTPAVATEPAPAATREHVIAQRDTFSSLAKKYGVMVADIAKANPGVDPAKLKVGKKLVIPEAAKAAAPAAATTVASADMGNLYVVKSGDNLGNIAKSHGTSVKALQEANGLKTTGIRVGQKLKLPASAKPAKNEAPTATSSPTSTTSATPATSGT
jgi:LysM repeat protein